MSFKSFTVIWLYKFIYTVDQLAEAGLAHSFALEQRLEARKETSGIGVPCTERRFFLLKLEPRGGQPSAVVILCPLFDNKLYIYIYIGIHRPSRKLVREGESSSSSMASMASTSSYYCCKNKIHRIGDSRVVLPPISVSQKHEHAPEESPIRRR